MSEEKLIELCKKAIERNRRVEGWGYGLCSSEEWAQHLREVARAHGCNLVRIGSLVDDDGDLRGVMVVEPKILI